MIYQSSTELWKQQYSLKQVTAFLASIKFPLAKNNLDKKLFYNLSLKIHKSENLCILKCYLVELRR